MASLNKKIAACKNAAIQVLLHNATGPVQGLPRTAGWGYPEPYTRDLLISVLGILVSENQNLIDTVAPILETLAEHQTEKGHIPSLVHDPHDLGASDTTPLFLLIGGIYRKHIKNSKYLEIAIAKAMLWMEYQNPKNEYLVAQLPTSDWRDEQWVLGYGLYVNTLVYSYLRILGQHERADKFLSDMSRFFINSDSTGQSDETDPITQEIPYLSFWIYKIYRSDRFDLLGNSLAILSGIASEERAEKIIEWVEKQCSGMRDREELTGDLPPNFFPFIQPEDEDWRDRYQYFNLPGDYHNGGIWPFVIGFYIAALVAAKKYILAEEKLIALTGIIEKSRLHKTDFGFNEWLKAQNNLPMGQDWQTWSASMYIYAATCVEMRETPFFDKIRNHTLPC